MPHVGNWRDKFFKEREGKYQVEDDTTKDELQQAKVLGKKIYITDQAIDTYQRRKSIYTRTT